MRFTFVLPLALATGALSDELVIPQVKAAVDAALEGYGNYAAYSGPTNEPPVPGLNAVKSQANESYWLEAIEHQGVAPFAPEGYKVFRNVKDFGAKGRSKSPRKQFFGDMHGTELPLVKCYISNREN